MSGAITQAVYMGVGSSGAMTDVSTYVDLDAAVNYAYGRATEFDDVSPGTFSFTLDNPDGRFTPGNASSPYATTVTEGMQVCWQAGARLVAGSVIGIEPAFPGDDAAWAKVVITCDDMLGNAARTQLDSDTVRSMLSRAGGYAYWPLDDETGSAAAVETLEGQPPLTTGSRPGYTTQAPKTFEPIGIDGVNSQQLHFFGGSSSATAWITDDPFKPIDYESGSIGAWGLWVTPTVLTDAAVSGYFQFHVVLANDVVLGFACGSSTNVWQSEVTLGGSLSRASLTSVATSLEPTYLSMVLTHDATTIYADFYVNGVLEGSRTVTSAVTDTSKQPQFVRIWHQDDSASIYTGFRISHVTHSAEPIHEEHLATLTTASQALGIADTVTGFTLTPPTGLATLETLRSDADSALDALNRLARTEQGYLYAATTGTVTAPVETIILRGRDRPTTVTASFDMEDEGDGAPSIIRDVTNLLRAVNVEGPTTTVTVADRSINSRSASTVTESVDLTSPDHLRLWGEDRLIRGGAVTLRITTAPVDAFTTPTDRSADLLALVPGDRIQLTDLPSTVLGFSTWDGWLLGADEVHALGQHLFELHLQPVLDDPALYDTGAYASDGALTLNAGINAAVTSLVYATTGPEFTTTNLPLDIVIDSEEMTVTACNTGTNTLTVTRGANGTTAAAHSAAAEIELAEIANYAF